MKVEAILKAKGGRVATTRPDLTIETVTHRLNMENVGAVVVSNDGNTVLGMVTERDIVHGLSRHGPALLEMTVGELMSVGMPSCAPDDTLDKVMRQMTLERTRYLPVIRNGRLCGIISIGDVVRSRLDEIEFETNVLRDAYRASR